MLAGGGTKESSLTGSIPMSFICCCRVLSFNYFSKSAIFLTLTTVVRFLYLTWNTFLVIALATSVDDLFLSRYLYTHSKFSDVIWSIVSSSFSGCGILIPFLLMSYCNFLIYCFLFLDSFSAIYLSKSTLGYFLSILWS